MLSDIATEDFFTLETDTLLAETMSSMTRLHISKS
jgi:hypothetical protein